MRRLSAVLIVASAVLPSLAHAASPHPAPPPDPDHGWYVAGKGGPSLEMLSGASGHAGSAPLTETDATNAVGAFGMAGGYEWSYRYHIPLRTELEFMNRTEMTYDASPLQKGGSGALASTVQNVTTMAKAYWHFPVGSTRWWPFVSGGVGWAHNTVKSEYTASGQAASKNTHAEDSVAWTVGAGATFKLGPQVMNDIEIRYVDLGSVDWGLPADRNVSVSGPGGLSATELVFSLRYMF
ncbi:outer membrane protein [Insolitispirillum peregrinum]|uniref:Opacity protein n=1 Tax=Insolitispirillum peregrinum TaxID=80876 RepID=A0A1N7L1N8_9PROT|nr:outer membrane beta-barrel protein [Insolitispirillum peregrinum]SIS67768.1 Opacity protein [Insolitispirillum peregrinum]